MSAVAKRRRTKPAAAPQEPDPAKPGSARPVWRRREVPTTPRRALIPSARECRSPNRVPIPSARNRRNAPFSFSRQKQIPFSRVWSLNARIGGKDMRTCLLVITVSLLLAMGGLPARAQFPPPSRDLELYRSPWGIGTDMVLDPVDSTVWVSFGDSVYHYDANNILLSKTRLWLPTWLCVDTHDGSCWVEDAGAQEYGDSGPPTGLFTRPPSSISPRTGVSRSPSGDSQMPPRPAACFPPSAARMAPCGSSRNRQAKGTRTPLAWCEFLPPARCSPKTTPSMTPWAGSHLSSTPTMAPAGSTSTALGARARDLH